MAVIAPAASRGRPTARLLKAVAPLVAGLSLLVAACPSGATTPRIALQSSQRPLPAGRAPSQIAKMVCSPKARQEIARVLGVRASVSTPTWLGHAYSCRYRYPDGEFVLTVKELSNWPQTRAYFAALGRDQGRTLTVPSLGQGSFQTDNGSMVVRKDWKILTVDIAGLPAQFGRPPTGRGDVAVTVADLILACWSGD